MYYFAGVYAIAVMEKSFHPIVFLFLFLVSTRSWNGDLCSVASPCIAIHSCTSAIVICCAIKYSIGASIFFYVLFHSVSNAFP